MGIYGPQEPGKKDKVEIRVKLCGKVTSLKPPVFKRKSPFSTFTLHRAVMLSLLNAIVFVSYGLMGWDFRTVEEPD